MNRHKRPQWTQSRMFGQRWRSPRRPRNDEELSSPDRVVVERHVCLTKSEPTSPTITPLLFAKYDDDDDDDESPFDIYQREEIKRQSRTVISRKSDLHPQRTLLNRHGSNSTSRIGLLKTMRHEVTHLPWILSLTGKIGHHGKFREESKKSRARGRAKDNEFTKQSQVSLSPPSSPNSCVKIGDDISITRNATYSPRPMRVGTQNPVAMSRRRSPPKSKMKLPNLFGRMEVISKDVKKGGKRARDAKDMVTNHSTVVGDANGYGNGEVQRHLNYQTMNNSRDSVCPCIEERIMLEPLSPCDSIHEKLADEVHGRCQQGRISHLVEHISQSGQCVKGDLIDDVNGSPKLLPISRPISPVEYMCEAAMVENLNSYKFGDCNDSYGDYTPADHLLDIQWYDQTFFRKDAGETESFIRVLDLYSTHSLCKSTIWLEN